MPLKGRLLHVGSGGAKLPEWIGKCEEVTLDINPSSKPDIVADILNMGEIGKFDVIYSSHVVEHFYQYQMPRLFGEFKRVLNDNGVVIIIVPDLEGIRATDDVVYISYFLYPVTGLDMIYGMPSEEAPYMAHHTGFTKYSMTRVLNDNGFAVEFIKSSNHNLLAIAKKI